MIDRIQALDIEQQVRDFIAKNLLYSENGFPFGDEVSFLQEGIVDSLGVVELVEFVQKTFGIMVSQPEVTREHFDSVASLAAFVRRKLSESPP